MSVEHLASSLVVDELTAARVLDFAVCALYFEDSSDYHGALSDIVFALSPEVHKTLQTNPKQAFENASGILLHFELGRK